MTTCRPRWWDIPPAARTAVESLVGSPVTGSQGTAGGFTGSLAEIVTCRDGRRWFVKGSHRGAGVYRREHDIMRALPPGLPVPACQGVVEADGWTLLVVEAVAGRTITLPWPDDLLSSALESVRLMYGRLAPAPPSPAQPIEVALAEYFDAWRARGDWVEDGRYDVDLLARLESEWSTHARGDCLLHCDLRADNMIADGNGKVWVVDWPSACVGAPIFDVVIFLVTVAMDGQHDPEAWLRRYGIADEPGVNAVLAAVTGYWFRASSEPEPPTAPGLRSHQRRSGESALRWLTARAPAVAG